ncbi:MAG: hypothetical protein EHM36_09305 [Deltaproteobacteria bacterium]|nr:MAG: hypothetical protein EHM36_09305 [Deltaproteobacteria bacterium]
MAKEEEVNGFFDRYIACYTEKDIHGFLRFFSSRAIQNKKEDFNEIKRIYTQFFDQSQSLVYRLKNPRTEIFADRVQVKASYEIIQFPRKGDRRLWRGNIEWALIRERGELKISSIQYQHDRSP